MNPLRQRGTTLSLAWRCQPWAGALRILLATAYLCATAPALAAPFWFGPYTSHRGEFLEGKVVAVGDLDGDDRDDIAISAGDSKVWLYLQTEYGLWQSAQAHVLPSAHVYGLEIVDLDGDGASELLVGHQGGLSVLTHANGWRHVSAATPCDRLAILDFNRDGKMDVACLGLYGYIGLYPGDGRGQVSAPTYIWTPVYGTYSGVNQFHAVDVTGDGLADLVAAGANPGFYIHPHDGRDGFLPAYGYSHGVLASPLSPGGIAVIDVDADGVDEIVVTSSCNAECAMLHVHRRDQLGFFRRVEDIPTFDSPRWPMVHDLDADGYMDLLVPHAGWSEVSRYMGSARGLSRKATRSPVSSVRGWSPGEFALGRLNGDHCIDLVLANSLGMTILQGRCAAEADDFSGNRVADMLWRNVATGENMIWRKGDFLEWGGDGPLEVVAVPAVTDLAWQVAGLGDFDGDGGSDILWRHAITGANAIWRGADYGRQLAVTGVTNVRWKVAGVGDFDGDGRSDILWRNSETGANVIWRHGNFGSQQAVRSVTDVRWRVAGTGDFDGDGRADILWRHATSGSNVIWRSADSTVQQAVTGVTDVRWEVSGIGDFNADNRADILWRRAVDGHNVIWASADSRMQIPVTRVAGAGWQVAGVADYDGDGWSDLLWRQTVTGANVIWLFGRSDAQVPVQPLRGAVWTVVRP